MYLRSGAEVRRPIVVSKKKKPPEKFTFPSLVAGLRSKNSNATRHFRVFLHIEWSIPNTRCGRPRFGDVLRMARLRKESEASRLLNQIVPGCTPCPLRSKTTDLVEIDHGLQQQFKDFLRSKQFTSLGLVLAGVWSNQTDMQLLATKKIRELVLFDHVCPPETLLEYGVVPRFDEFLREDSLELHTEAALAVIDIISVTLADLWFDHGLLEILLKLLDSPSSDVREKAVSKLGDVAAISRGRDLVHQLEAVHPLVGKVLCPLLDELDKNAKLDGLDKDAKLDKLNENDKLLPKLRSATKTLLRFCKGVPKPGLFHEEVTKNEYGTLVAYSPFGSVIKSPHLDKVRAALPELIRLVSLTDEEVLTDACWILACLTDTTYCNRVDIDIYTCQRLVKLLEHQSPSVVTPALRTLGNIVFTDDTKSYIHSEHLVDVGALPCLWKLLSKSTEEMEVWTTIANITKWHKRQIKAAQMKSTILPLSGFVGHENEGKKQKMEVKEKLDKYEKEKLLTFCLDLDISIPVVEEATATKDDIVAKLMDFLEARHAMTSELLAEKEQSSEGKKRGRESTKSPPSSSLSSKGSTKSKKMMETVSQKAEKKNNVHESEDGSEQEEDDNEEVSQEENANSGPERSDEGMSDQAEHEEENESKDTLRPSDDKLCAAVGKILRKIDISKTSFTTIVEQLSKMFRTDLTPRKSHILIMMRYQLVQITRENKRGMITDERYDDGKNK